MEKNTYRKVKILKNEKISCDIFLIELEGKFKGKPGQFYMLRGWNEYPLLARPISIHDLEENKITFLYQVVGKGTKIISKLKINDTLQLLGPLGNSFPINSKNKNIAIVSGGIGIAPMKYLAKRLKGNIDLYAGFKDEDYLIDELSYLFKNTIISTETGRVGKKGFITEFIKDKYDVIYACGPNPMMQSLNKLNLQSLSYYSMEANMACGIGACLGCSIETKNGIKRVCHDGPIFESKEVIFND